MIPKGVWYGLEFDGALIVAGLGLFWANARLRRLFGKTKPNRHATAAPGAAAAVIRRVRRMARSTLLLAPTKAPGFSKLGGQPEMPEKVAWPSSENRPRAFLAQLDLAEVRAAGGPEWLPGEGRLYAFCDDQGAGCSDHVTIVHSAEVAGAPREWPPTLSAQLRFPERRASFLVFTSIPSPDWLGVDLEALDLSDDDRDELADMAGEAFGDELQHRIGGYPGEIQPAHMPLECEHLARGLDPPEWDAEVPPAVERASKSWRLLLQIDSDPALKMNWGDGGRLYVFIREKHALAGDFSKTVTLSQTY
jgi:hypothetical protein